MAAEDNYKQLRAELDARLRADKRLAAIAEKISSGKADFADTARYSQIVSHIMGEVISKNIGKITEPLGKEAICKELLRDYYESINGILGNVQARVDKELGIHLKNIRAPFPAERVDKAAHSLEDPTVPEETIERRARSVTENISVSMHDDYIKENARYRSKAGLKSYITRDAGGGCCKWCQALAGRYDYASAPDDVFKRHDNCTCTVTYECGRMHQDVWSKKKWEADPKDVQVRKEFAEQGRPRVYTRDEAKTLNESFAKPVVYTREQARELEARLLDKSEKSGIIESVSKQQDFMDRNPREQFSRYVIDPKTGERVLEEWSFRSNPLGEYPNIFSQTYSEDARAMAEYLNEKVNNGDYGKVDRIVIAKNEDLRGISSYDYTKNTLYISEELITKEGFERLVDKSYFPARNLDDVITHELDGHKRHWDMVKKFYNDNLNKYSSLKDAKQDFERELREYIILQKDSDRLYVLHTVSHNAERQFTEDSILNELIADSAVLYRRNQISDERLTSLFLEVVKYDDEAK